MNSTRSRRPHASARKRVTTQPLNRTQPQQARAALEALALSRIPAGPGRSAVPLVWLALASHLRRRSTSRRVWPSNARLAMMTGLAPRMVERALALLVAAGKISTAYGARGKGYHRGRIITLALELPASEFNPVVIFPCQARVRELWSWCSRLRARPGTCVALAVAIQVWACAEQGKTRGLLVCRPAMAFLRVLVGASHGSTFNRRLAELADAGVLQRRGERWSDGFVLLLANEYQPRRLPALPEPRMRRFENSDSRAAMDAWVGRCHVLHREQAA